MPAGAYREMKEWSGGFWRNFLSRYPESNRMHKKMLAVRRRWEQLPEGELRDRAQRLIWAGQCNCAYWHGVAVFTSISCGRLSGKSCCRLKSSSTTI